MLTDSCRRLHVCRASFGAGCASPKNLLGVGFRGVGAQFLRSSSFRKSRDGPVACESLWLNEKGSEGLGFRVQGSRAYESSRNCGSPTGSNY